MLDADPKDFRAQAAQKLFRDAIRLRNRFNSGEMKLAGFYAPSNTNRKPTRRSIGRSVDE